jgi:hypothetical protein
LRQHYWEIRSLGVVFVAVANEAPENHAELRERLDLPFQLLSDPDSELARALHVFHENEPKGRLIARPAMFLIDTHANGNKILWEHVSPTSRHRVEPSRIMEELLTALGYRRQVVSVIVPSSGEVERRIAAFQDPPLGFVRTPDEVQPGVLTERDFMRQLAMAANAEVHRLAEDGWTLSAVAPEFDGARPVGQRYIFERTLLASAVGT